MRSAAEAVLSRKQNAVCKNVVETRKASTVLIDKSDQQEQYLLFGQ